MSHRLSDIKKTECKKVMRWIDSIFDCGWWYCFNLAMHIRYFDSIILFTTIRNDLYLYLSSQASKKTSCYPAFQFQTTFSNGTSLMSKSKD